MGEPRQASPVRRARPERSPGPFRGAAARRSLAAGALAALLASPVAAEEAAQAPFPEDERLSYSIVWPSGLGVGTAEFRARRMTPGWRFDATLRANLPDFAVDDAFSSRTDGDLCSIEFDKHVRHGAKRAHESLRFRGGALERTNLEADPGRAPPPGIAVPECARDALAGIYFLRRELAAGRLPPPTDVYFGAGYQLLLKYEETRWLVWDGGRREADAIRVEVRGPASHHRFSAYFGRDPARTPLLVQVEIDGRPFAMRLAD